MVYSFGVPISGMQCVELKGFRREIRGANRAPHGTHSSTNNHGKDLIGINSRLQHLA
jgi:hypothetical protein